MVDGDQDGTATAVEAAFGAYLGEAAVRADRLRAEAARGLVLAVRQAADRGWSQRRIAAALGRSQPEVARLLRRRDAVPPAVDVAPVRREVVVDGAPVDPHGAASPGERADGPPPETVLNRVLGSQRDAIVAAAGRHGAGNVRVFGSVARGEDGPDSDVDLLVDPGDEMSLVDLGRLEDELTELLGRPVDVVPARSLRPVVAATVEAIAL
ncbi:nucleotidyltransferase domain-containing protein [Cellulomonas sp. GbtcB1]|uniref:nucleotidyltransferase domain-containing protein n=1 Tax=Cellulomonas sp. GbtcB1 TaxID=2824746 RepID=UPI001C311AD4|nr:nucleotidyltransferase domain-containing protein [Cellulomonas sp. GbtcB1]